MVKNEYKISLWEDYLVPKKDNIPEHYEEREICIIGSSSMTSQTRVSEPKLVRNVNGTNTLTFKLYYSYIDNETGEKVRNPFISLLTNERKVKCFWDNEWYDFIVKSIQEDSSGKTITYTCTDIFANELSKTGFNLEFDNDLNNNQGSAQELGEKILEGTDWSLDLTKSDHILQTIEEPLYKAILKKDLVVEDKTFSSGSIIYVFYSVIQNKETYFQFISNESYETETNSQLLKENNCYGLDITNFDNWITEYLTINTNELSNYRGKRLVRQQLQKFNEAVGRYCYVFEDSTHSEILGFSTVEYKDPTTVLNIISNSKEFTDTNGWQGNIGWNLYPPFYDSELTEAYESTTYLRVNPSTIFNTGLQNSAIYLEDGLQRGQRYFLRIKAFGESNDAPTNSLISKDKVNFAVYDFFNSLSDGTSIPAHNTTNYFELKNSTIEDGWIQLEVECINSVPREQLTAGYLMEYENEASDSGIKQRMAKPGIFITLGETCWIQEVQFYQKVEGYNGKIIHLGDMDTQSVGTTYYKYFIPDISYKTEDDIKYLYCGTEKQSYEKVYEGTNANYVKFEKIRSIQGKNSNRFNFLQSVAETFECWVRFEVKHDSTGRIIYKDGCPQKTVYFKKDIGKELGYGFIYGIDLKTISRTIDSNQIASKVIVSPNINEYAKDGICEIAQSEFNETGENYILNFDYYISQGLLNGGEFDKYCYLTTEEGQGFYPSLKNINSAYNARALEISAKKTELTKQSSLKTVYDQYVSSAGEQISSLKSQLAFLAGLSEYDFKKVAQYLQDHPDNTNVKNLFTTLATTEHNKESYEQTLSKLETSVANLTAYIEDLESKNNELLEQKKTLEGNFYKKFSRFIQEGSWASQDYLDENLYYLDARGVAYTSSRPKISYNISVIRLSALPEFKGKVFDVGDISYIEDIDFFGYISGSNGWKTPYKEQVLISEKTTYFDSPEKDTFTIQNYKTQFEDLFQRITATTQALQYSSGEYQRAADIVDSNGIINGETLQNSIATNNQLVFASQNEEIYQDSTGLTLSDKNDPSKKTKLTSGGLFISTDGGVTWKNAVRGEGIATQYLTAGAINVNNITIFDGNNPTFRWDQYGLSAYAVSRDDNGVLLGVNPQTFVRFDRFGVYGINGTEDGKDFVPKEESEIKSKAKFGMTWSGFFLKNNEGNGTVEISTENDILITKNEKERVKIGRLGNDLFGIRFQDDNGNVTLETDDLGRLWLKDKLNISSEEFSQTSDETVEEDKPYYTKNEDGSYSQVAIDSESNPKELGYYEKTHYDVSIGNLGGEEKNQIINANNRFIVYEDGSMVATNGTFSGDITGSTGTFTGRIEATNGRIGGLEISANSIVGDPFAALTESSLTLNNGTFTILDKEGNPAFYTDENGNLTFTGNLNGARGTFSGDLEAVGGTFSGDISAASGTFSGGIMASYGQIGGFTISQNELTSIGTSIIDEEESANIILNGADGHIYARNIELGEGATIEKNITLGKAKIWNPEVESHNYFLEVGDNVYLTEDGKMSFGTIDIDGSTNDPTIIGHEDGITYWKINKDSAIFKNITASGGTIENVVFKKSTIQSSSGAMIFKPSAYGWFEKINDKNYFFFKDDADSNFFAVGDKVLLSGSTKAELGDGQDNSIVIETSVIAVGADGSYYCELDTPAENCNTIIKLYSYKEDGNILADDLLIGVNSNSLSSDSLNIDKFLFREGFTFTSPVIENGEVSYPAIPKLFMGNLTSIGKQGYGLYADNVYLNGTITTTVPTANKKTYAGINTLSGYVLPDGSNDKIVFWAGAPGESEIDIQSSPFIVSDTGKLFASDGYFSRSVFVESEIRGTDIYTARLHGTGNTKEYSARMPALIIYNTSENSNGIEFRTEKTSLEDPTTERGLFRICGDKFEAIKISEENEESSTNFIQINNGNVSFLGDTFEGKVFKVNQKNKEYLEISGDGIFRKNPLEDGTISTDTSIELKTDSVLFNVGEEAVLEAKQSLIEIPRDLSVARNVTYGDGGIIMEYQQVDDGYDLYIHEDTEDTSSTTSIADKAIANRVISAKTEESYEQSKSI